MMDNEKINQLSLRVRVFVISHLVDNVLKLYPITFKEKYEILTVMRTANDFSITGGYANLKLTP